MVSGTRCFPSALNNYSPPSVTAEHWQLLTCGALSCHLSLLFGMPEPSPVLPSSCLSPYPSFIPIFPSPCFMLSLSLPARLGLWRVVRMAGCTEVAVSCVYLPVG